jgi:glycosyltransferase involved in cell wall biosynthesis
MMSEIQPKISVVIPAYNAERYLREALESVLAQHYPALDILVIDDGSADGTAGVAQSVGGRSLRPPGKRRGGGRP